MPETASSFPFSLLSAYLCSYLYSEIASSHLPFNATNSIRPRKRRGKADDGLPRAKGLSLLCTSPKYFRRGAAKALLVPMLEIADREGLRAYLEATPAGRPVYEKLGFREVDALRFELPEATGDDHGGIAVLSVMIREPRTAS